MNSLSRRSGCRAAAGLGALTAITLGWGIQPAQAGYTIQDIVDPLNTAFTQALGINNAGTVVGYGNATTFNGFQLVPPAGFTRENFPGATGGTQVVGIDGAGDTVGFYVNPDGSTHGFFKPVAGAFQTVDQSGSVFNQLLGINHSGNEIAGYSSFSDATGATGQQAFSLSGGSYTNVNALLPTNANSQATGVNDAHSVVGFYMPTGATSTGFLDKGGVITNIDPFGSTFTQALGINDNGEIVGVETDAMGFQHGYVDINGVFTMFDPPDSASTTINGVNAAGQIVGFFTDNDTDSVVGFIATPTATPEPASLAILAVGLIGFGAIRRRRKSI